MDRNRDSSEKQSVYNGSVHLLSRPNQIYEGTYFAKTLIMLKMIIPAKNFTEIYRECKKKS